MPVGQVVALILVLGVLAFSIPRLISLPNSGGGVIPDFSQVELVAQKLVHEVGNRTLVWAKGPADPADKRSRWFDFTDSPIEPAALDHGIGRDTIVSIDRPLYVEPDDPRLVAQYRLGPINDLQVFGYHHNGESRAFPLALMDRHELVNDTIGGKPVTIGW